LVGHQTPRLVDRQIGATPPTRQRVAHDEALPFEPLTPNATTIQAMKDARSGLVTKAASLDALFVDLNADT
jgi:antitoxin component of RelBE/YafQ-DinJ toxin-antitoxin module